MDTRGDPLLSPGSILLYEPFPFYYVTLLGSAFLTRLFLLHYSRDDETLRFHNHFMTFSH